MKGTDRLLVSAELSVSSTAKKALSLPPVILTGHGPKTPIRVYGDEVCASANEIGVLRYFERGRTDAIGGASGLQQLQAAGTLIVVTGISCLRIAADAQIRGGDDLLVRSRVQMRARNTLAIFQQSLWRGDCLLAEGEVTCASISAHDMKLSPCPPEIVQRLVS